MSQPELEPEEQALTPDKNEYTTIRRLLDDKRKLAGVVVAVIAGAVIAVLVIAGFATGWKFGNAVPGEPVEGTPQSSEVVEGEGEETLEEVAAAEAEENSQGLSTETVESLAESSTDGDGLIDFIQYNPSERNYTVVVRNTSGADETYSVSVLVNGEAVGAQGVEVPAASTATVTVAATLPRGTTEVTVRLDGQILGEGIVEVLHQN